MNNTIDFVAVAWWDSAWSSLDNVCSTVVIGCDWLRCGGILKGLGVRAGKKITKKRKIGAKEMILRRILAKKYFFASKI